MVIRLARADREVLLLVFGGHVKCAFQRAHRLIRVGERIIAGKHDGSEIGDVKIPVLLGKEYSSLVGCGA